MIASLKGILTQRLPEGLVVDVGGVGYKVAASLQTFSRLPVVGEEVFLYVHTAVREDDISLFGFLEEAEKRIFQKLIAVNGIGPRLALTILSGILPRELAEALHREDLVRLTAIPGIGKKTAERMILDLKDKLVEFLGEGKGAAGMGNGDGRLLDEATSALLNLGYTRAHAERALSHVSLREGLPVEKVIREALRVLSEVRW